MATFFCATASDALALLLTPSVLSC